MSDVQAPLSVELATYNSRLPELLKESGRFVLIHEQELVGTFETYQDALAAGYSKFQLTPFLVKRVAVAEQVSYFSRSQVPCPA